MTMQPEETLFQPGSDDCEAIVHFKEALARGEHWYPALLDAVALWDKAEETVGERRYQYLIAGEAFDWLALAERLCDATDGLVPEEERLALLFQNRPPIDLGAAQFKEKIGPVKHRAHLNFVYGVVVEEALQQSMERAVRKESIGQGFTKEARLIEEVHRRIYGASQSELLAEFRQEHDKDNCEEIGLTELKEFTYWLFKFRIARSDQSRLASDTRRGLEELERLYNTADRSIDGASARRPNASRHITG